MSIERHRVSVIIDKSDEKSFHELVEIKGTSLVLPSIQYHRQDRFTIPVDLVSSGWHHLLKRCNSLRLQFTNDESFDHSIFGDYMQQGLSINYIPDASAQDRSALRKDQETISKTIAQLLRLDVRPESFIMTPTSLKFADHSVGQDAIHSMVQEMLPVAVRDNWQSVQIDYDPEDSSNLVIEVYWDKYISSDTFSFDKSIRTEIGVFSLDEKLTTIDNIGLNGVRFILNEKGIDTKKTAFQFSPRHRLIPDVTFSTTVSEPVGLHPNLKLEIHNSTLIEPPLKLESESESINSEICQLYSVMNIPKDFFIDRYQVKDEKFEEHGLKMIGLFGDSNLELPSYKMPNWGTETLLQLDITKSVIFDLPLHSRYEMPSNEASFNTSLPNPTMFWACDLQVPISILTELGKTGDLSRNIYLSQIAELESTLQVLSKSPFQHKFLDYESYFDDNTVFYHLESISQGPLIAIPVAPVESAESVEFYTLSLVFSSFIFLLYKLFR